MVTVVTDDRFVTWEMKRLAKAASALGAHLNVITPDRWWAAVGNDRYFRVTPHERPSSGARRRWNKTDGGMSTTVPSVVLGRVGTTAFHSLLRLLDMWETAGIRVVNGALVHRRGRDKAAQSVLLKAWGVPHPDTVVASWSSIYDNAMKKHMPFTFPMVVKPVDGSGGQGVFRVDSWTDLRRAWPPHGGTVVLQPYIDGVREYRVMVLGRRVVGSVFKTPGEGDWRGNATTGAQWHKANIPDAVHRWSVRACEAIGATVAAVDVLQSETGYHVLEVNVCPGFQHFSEVTGIDFAWEMMAYVLSACTRPTTKDGDRWTYGSRLPI